MLYFYGFSVAVREIGNGDTVCHTDIGADTNPKVMVSRLAAILNDVRSDNKEVKLIEIGQVRANDAEEALDRLQAGKWLDNEFRGYA